MKTTFNDPVVQDHTPGRINNNVLELFSNPNTNAFKNKFFRNCKDSVSQNHARDC